MKSSCDHPSSILEENPSRPNSIQSLPDVDQAIVANEETIADLYLFYWIRIVGFARSRLKPHMRSKFDSQDLAQSAFRTFYRRHAKQPFDLSDRDAVWPLLATILIRKLSNKIEHFGAQKRNWHEEIPLDVFEAKLGGTTSNFREPSPDEAAMLRELVSKILDRQSEIDRAIAYCCLEGLSIEEICVAVGCSRSKASRVRSRIKKELENWENLV